MFEESLAGASKPSSNRPTSVTVIAWLALLGAAGSVFTLIRVSFDPNLLAAMRSTSRLPIEASYVHGGAGVVVGLIAGIFLLAGANWARILYLAFGASSHLITLGTTHFTPLLLPGIVYYLVVLILLTRPRANAFFRPTNRAADQ